MGDRVQLLTARRYDFYECSSALQKAIRRADAKLAGYWAIELWESGFDNYVWKRLLTISAEDVWGIITKEIEALHYGYKLVNETTKQGGRKGRIFIAKAVLLLCAAKKSRDADHLTNFVYDKGRGFADFEAEIEAELTAVREESKAIPEYAHDVHTRRGRMMGKTKADFFKDEHNALTPRQPGLFDALAEAT